MKYVIKEVTKDNIDDYIAINAKVWQESYRGIIDDSFLDDIDNHLDDLIVRKRNNIAVDKKNEIFRYVLYLNNTPIGLCSCDKSREKDYPYSGELRTLYLLKKYQGNGYGKLMLEKCVSKLLTLGYNDMIVHCICGGESNNFYKHLGFRNIGKSKIKIDHQELYENIYYYTNIENLLDSIYLYEN
jgi:GNAT superfamily N-acetyltransferase